MMSKLSALLKHLSTFNAEWNVPLKWLAKSQTELNRKFKQTAKVSVSECDDLQHVTINEELFLWPRNCPLDDLLVIASELMNPDHPHQYLWGPTRIERGDVVMDIGACEGSFSARAAALGARVIAVEPSKLQSSLIRQLFNKKGLDEPLIVKCLLDIKPGSKHFIDVLDNPGRSRPVESPLENSYPVEVETMDGLVQRLRLTRLDFIKCDAEGADVDILKGGRESLLNFRPKIAVCTYHNDNDFLDLHRYLTGLGYNVVGKGFLHSHRKLRINMIHAWC